MQEARRGALQNSDGIDRQPGIAPAERRKMKARRMTQVIGRRRYSTATATLLASDTYWDGHNFERQGRNTFLYRTPRGAYFAVHQTNWQGESDSLVPMAMDEAYQLFEDLSEKELSFADAFPTVKIEEA